MSILKKEEKKYTYRDYLNWLDEERWELIDGVPYNMVAAPSRWHQQFLVKFLYQIENYLKDKTCQVFCAPFDVRLPKGNEKDEDIESIVQPDIVVVCEPSKLDDKGCKGSPDLIIEITSPATAKKDLKEKLFLYERVGVKEYWVVQPVDKTVMVFKINKDAKYGKYELYAEEDNLKMGIFEDFTIDLKEVFG